MNTEQKRLEKERLTFLRNRKGAGRAVKGIKRVVSHQSEGKSVSGCAILIRPQAFNRDCYRSLLHFAKCNGIVLVREEVIPPSVSHDFEIVVSWTAIGHPDALRELANHKYIGQGNWEFVTETAKPE